MIINGSRLRSWEFRTKSDTFNTGRPIVQSLIFQRMTIIHWFPSLIHILQFGYRKVFIFLILVFLIDFRRFNCQSIVLCKSLHWKKYNNWSKDFQLFKTMEKSRPQLLSYFDPSGIKIEGLFVQLLFRYLHLTKRVPQTLLSTDLAYQKTRLCQNCINSGFLETFYIDFFPFRFFFSVDMWSSC